MSKKTILSAFSTGGVVFRPMSQPASNAHAPQSVGLPQAEIALVGRSRESLWTLPKGTPEPGETREQTALREVREETGLETRVVGELGVIEYTFSRRGVRYNKQVFHYLLRATGGSLDGHDHEYDDVRWFPFADALHALTYANEVEILRRAAPLIAAQIG